MIDRNFNTIPALIDELRAEFRLCEHVCGESCPAAVYIEHPPVGLGENDRVRQHMIKDVEHAKCIMGKCLGCGDRLARLDNLANRLILQLGLPARG